MRRESVLLQHIRNSSKQDPSFQSLFGLSALVFFIADVQGGVGPFLSIYLQSDLKWDAGQIGIALATVTIIAALCQIPSGLLVDATKLKRFIIFLACLFITAGCLIIMSFTNLLPIVAAQSLFGLASAIIHPTIGAITLGLVGREFFPKRTSLNETWNHAGNLVTALAMGLLAHVFGHSWILYTIIFFAIASVSSLLLIRPKEINHAMARELAEVSSQDESITEPIQLRTFLKSSPIIIFIFSVILFHLSNAAQLPLVGELLAKKNPHSDALFMALSIILAQLVMMIVAYSLGFFMKHFGRKPIFLIAFLVLPIRAMLYTFTQNPYLLLSIQLLDGIGAGIFGVIAVVIISDLAKNSGRFNFAQGLVALCTAIGGSLSNMLAGFAVKYEGFHGGFILLAIIAVIGSLFYGLLMPETKNMTNAVLPTGKNN